MPAAPRPLQAAFSTALLSQPQPGLAALRPGHAPPLITARDSIMIVRLVEAQYENGVLRPVEHLGLRPGELVKLMVIRRPDPRRWDLARLATTPNQEDLSLSEQGLADWADSLDATERR